MLWRPSSPAPLSICAQNFFLAEFLDASRSTPTCSPLVSYLQPAASSRRSCTRFRCCRRRRARSSRCRWAPAPWTCRWRRRQPWRRRTGCCGTPWSCPDTPGPGTARSRCSSGTDQSSPPAGCPCRPRSSRAGWSTLRWRWRRGWWRWPTGRRWRGSCARSWSGRFWQPRRRGAWWWWWWSWCWGPQGPYPLDSSALSSGSAQQTNICLTWARYSAELLPSGRSVCSCSHSFTAPSHPWIPRSENETKILSAEDFTLHLRSHSASSGGGEGCARIGPSSAPTEQQLQLRSDWIRAGGDPRFLGQPTVPNPFLT